MPEIDICAVTSTEANEAAPTKSVNEKDMDNRKQNEIKPLMCSFYDQATITMTGENCLYCYYCIYFSVGIAGNDALCILLCVHCTLQYSFSYI